MARRKQQSGMTLIEALMASALLAMAAAGILLPITAAAAAQTDAQRRVIATRFAADVIERLIAEGYDAIKNDYPVNGQYDPIIPLGQYPEPVYSNLSAKLFITYDSVGQMPDTIDVVILTVKVSDNNRPMITLKTLIGDGHL